MQGVGLMSRAQRDPERLDPLLCTIGVGVSILIYGSVPVLVWAIVWLVQGIAAQVG